MTAAPKTKSSQLKAVLCDMDGTLVDSNHLHAEAWSKTFEHFGITVTFDQALHQIGKGSDHLIPEFIPDYDLPRLSEKLQKYRKELFESTYFSQIKPFPEARELLLKMKAIGLRVAVATSASKKDLNRLKKIANIEDLVEQETSADDAERSKPEPDIFESTLKLLKIDAHQALALGDTPWDIESARNAGMQTVAVTSGGWKEHELREAGALEVYKDVAELSRQFETSPFSR